MTSIYLLKNLDCANCAAKIEAKLNRMPEIKRAIITFATKQMEIEFTNDIVELERIQKICQSIESDIQVTDKITGIKAKPEEKSWIKQRALWELIFGGSIFLVAFLWGTLEESYKITLFVLAYVILGGKIVLTAGKNLLRGHVFDENFLMSIATLGAFAIQEYPEAVGVMLFYRIGEFFEECAVEKSRRQIMQAVDLRPDVVTRLSGGKEEIIEANAAQIDDILLVKAGERIPLDGVVQQGESRVDTAPVTGEPIPVKVAIGDEVISGCINTSGLLQIRVKNTLADSMVTRILDSVEHAAANKPKVDRFITKFARVYTPIVVMIAIFTAIVPSLFTGNWEHWIYTALTFLVISCPCALVLSVPLTFFAGIGAGAKRGILFKGGSVLESLKRCKAIVMDKTGTITEGKFAVREIAVFGTFKENEVLALCASLETASTHPIGVSIVAEAKARNLTFEEIQNVEELSGKGIKGDTVKGQVLCGSRSFLVGMQIDVPEYQGQGIGTEVFIALDKRVIGCLFIADKMKSDAIYTVKQLKKKMLHTFILTGDQEKSAEKIAKAVGVDGYYAKLLPEEKLNRLSELREKYDRVMFVGDGINDAPVLAGADVGAAMGSGADAAIEAADIVFMNSRLSGIHHAIEIAHKTGKIAKQNVVFALGVKNLIMILGLAGFASMWLAVFADSGVAMLCVVNAIRILYEKEEKSDF